jgi:AcrR family transcriptional regulator
VTASTPTKRRGRPREFDEDEVLDALVELFWDRGFEAASLNEIVEASNLNKSSLYNAFGSKDDLFVGVLSRYVEFRSAVLNEAMAEGGLDTLLGFVAMLRDETNGESGCRGCLAVNASTELGHRSDRVAEFSRRYRSLLRAGLRGPLQRAGDAGEIDPRLVDTYVDAVLATTVAVAVAQRSGADQAELDSMVDSLQSLIESWRID